MCQNCVEYCNVPADGTRVDEYREPDRYYCERCDSNVVVENVPETGKFLFISGCDVKNNAYVTIKYAICLDCLK